MGLIRLLRPWDRQPPAPNWSALARRAHTVVHTGAGIVAGRFGPLTQLNTPSRTRPNKDGTWLIGRNEEGELRCPRYEFVSHQPASVSAFCLAAEIERSSSTNFGYLSSWGETSTAIRCHVASNGTVFTVTLRQGQFDTPRVQNYAITAGVRSIWAVRAVAGGACDVYNDGVLQTPTSSSGTMPASMFYTSSSQPVWMGGAGDFSAFGGLYGLGLWFEDLGESAVIALSRDLKNMLHAPRSIWVPVSAGGSTTYTLSAPTYVPGSITSTGLTARVTVTAA